MDYCVTMASRIDERFIQQDMPHKYVFSKDPVLYDFKSKAEVLFTPQDLTGKKVHTIFIPFLYYCINNMKICMHFNRHFLT